MKSSIIGMLGGVFLIWYSVNFSSAGNISYLDKLGLVIVVGGTICSSIITFGFKKLIEVVSIIFKVFIKNTHNEDKVVRDLCLIAEKISIDPRSVQKFNKDETIHPFIRDGLRLIENELECDVMEELMLIATEKRKEYQLIFVDVIRTLSKYPPAFGMIGTVIGLVALLTTVGKAEASVTIGPAMATALLTTLYGLICSHLFLVPLGDNLMNRLNEDIQLRGIILEAMVLIRKGEDPLIVKEHILAHLLPGQKESYYAIEKSAA